MQRKNGLKSFLFPRKDEMIGRYKTQHATFTSQRNEIHGIILQERGPSSTVRDFKRNYDEDEFHVIFILALIALGMFTLIIIVGVLHNCIKRLKHRSSHVSESDDSTSVQIYSPSAPKETLSYPEVVQV